MNDFHKQMNFDKVKLNKQKTNMILLALVVVLYSKCEFYYEKGNGITFL